MKFWAALAAALLAWAGPAGAEQIIGISAPGADGAHPAQVALGPGTTVEDAERQLIQMTLEHTRDNKTRAAEILGISLKTLHNKLNRLRLRPKKKAE